MDVPRLDSNQDAPQSPRHRPDSRDIRTLHGPRDGGRSPVGRPGKQHARSKSRRGRSPTVGPSAELAGARASTPAQQFSEWITESMHTVIQTIDDWTLGDMGDPLPDKPQLRAIKDDMAKRIEASTAFGEAHRLYLDYLEKASQGTVPLSPDKEEEVRQLQLSLGVDPLPLEAIVRPLFNANNPQLILPHSSAHDGDYSDSDEERQVWSARDHSPPPPPAQQVDIDLSLCTLVTLHHIAQYLLALQLHSTTCHRTCA